MRIDEKIALLEKEKRQQIKQMQHALDLQYEERKPLYSVDFFKIGFKAFLVFLDPVFYRMEIDAILDHTLLIPVLKDYFQIVCNTPTHLIAVNEKHKVSIVIESLKEWEPRNPLQEWATLLLADTEPLYGNTMVRKVRSYEDLDYCCLDISAVTGLQYQIFFRIYWNNRYLIGTCSCRQEDWGTVGSFLEAFVLELYRLNTA